MRASIYRITIIPAIGILPIVNLSTQTISPNIPACAFDEMNEMQRLADPVFEQEWRGFLDETIPNLSAQQRNAIEPLMTISVVVHVIHSGEPIGQGSNLSDERVEAQIAILNKDFCSLNEKFYDTPAQWSGLAGTPNIQFLLATTDPDGNATNGIDRHNIPVTGTSWNNNNINSEIKPMVNWDPDRYMNIYVVSIPGTTASGGVVGYSNYPIPSQIGTDRDGPVVDYNWFGGPGLGASGWRPISHETGHYLGLPHTFNGSSCNDDDGIADTPNVDDATSVYATLDCDDGFPAGPVSCGSEHLYVNYMDYVDENCYTSYTHGQVNVMRSVLDGTSSGFGYGSREELIAQAPSQTFVPANDAGVTRLISPSFVNCTPDTLVPEVTLRNFGSEDLTGVTIKYQVDNGPVTSYTWTGNLFPGELANVVLPSFSPPDGNYVLNFFTENPNGATDDRPENDELVTGMFTYFAFDPPMIETAENETAFPTQFGTFEFNVDNDDFRWEITDEASGYGFGNTSFVFNNRAGDLLNNPAGTLDALITRHFDFTDVTGAALYFDVAYAPYSAIQNDTLIVLVSTDCTQNFNQIVYANGGESLATAPATQSLFTPTPFQWRADGVDLSDYDGMDDVAIAFLNLSNWGNRLFIDNIRVGVDCGLLSAEWEVVPDGCGNPVGTCTGEATVSVPVSNGNLSYQWEGWPANYNEPSISGVCAGEVSVTITDSFGCQVAATAEVPSAPGPELQATSTDVTAYNQADGTATVTVSGGTAPFSFAWSNGVNATSNFPMHTINNLPEGTYTVEVEDANGCSSIIEVEVSSVCAGFFITTFDWDVSCFGEADGSALANTFNGNGPFGFLWSNGVTTQLNESLPAGTHFVTVTDVNGCPATDTVSIGEPTELVLSTSSTNETALNANNGTATANPTGGTPNYSYAWSNGATTQSVEDLSPGIYAVTVTDANGCIEMALVSIQSFSCENFDAGVTSTDATCFGMNDGTANVFASGETQPLDIVWSNGETSAFIQNLPTGNFTVTITDASGCSSELAISISEPSELGLGISSTPETSPGANNGTASVNVSGGTPFPGGNYEFDWSNGGVAATISDLVPGTYSVTVTDLNGCTKSATVEVAASTCQLSIQMSVVDASCPTVADGTATVDDVPGATPPLEYDWSNGQTGMVATGLLAGNYFVTVTDAVGCTVSGWVVLAENDVMPPTLVLQDTFLLFIQNTQAVFDAVMADNGSFDNCSLVNLQASQELFGCDDIGVNEVTISASDWNGNQASANIIVLVRDTVPPSLSCPDNIVTTDCGAIDYVTPSANDNCGLESVSLVEGLESGASFPIGETPVTWEAVDLDGNISQCSFSVTVESDLAINIVEIVHALPGQNGSIDWEVIGGNPPFQSTWFENGVELPGFDPADAPSGIYEVIVMDAGGCTVSSGPVVVDFLNSSVSVELDKQINLYPNPTSGNVVLGFSSALIGRCEIEVVDVAGNTRFKKTIPSLRQTEILDIYHLNAGVYWLKIVLDEGLIWKKIIVI